MRTPLTWAIGMMIVVAVPLLGKWARRGEPPCCAFDGARLEPLFRVRLVEAHGGERLFCSVRCAQLWRARSGAPAMVYVTDEASGREVEAARAVFVRSVVATPPTTRSRIHAFARREDAERHARAYRGEVLVGLDRPFGVDK